MAAFKAIGYSNNELDSNGEKIHFDIDIVHKDRKSCTWVYRKKQEVTFLKAMPEFNMVHGQVGSLVCGKKSVTIDDAKNILLHEYFENYGLVIHTTDKRVSALMNTIEKIYIVQVFLLTIHELDPHNHDKSICI